MVEVTIDNNKYIFEEGLTILQACEKINVNIPKFCFHDKLSIAGNCRMCLVEVSKSPKPVASCAMPLTNGMSIFTDTPLVKKARESVLEFILLNHPLDCPICDQGGECDLQDQSLHYGSDRSRFFKYKNTMEDKECGPIIKTIMTRCITCTRCVRFAKEIAGVPVLGAFGRGVKTEIGTYIDTLVKTELSGNLVDICPVGALTSKPYAFRGRPWELQRSESVDFFDSVGMNINIYTRQVTERDSFNTQYWNSKEQILRVLPKSNKNLDHSWISDKTRYGVEGIVKNRNNHITCMGIQNNIKIESWDHFFSFVKFKVKENQNKFVFNLGTILSLDNLFYIYKFSKIFSSTSFMLEGRKFYNNNDFVWDFMFNSKYNDILDSDLICLIGTNLRSESSGINTLVRQKINDQKIPIFVLGSKSNLNYDYVNIGNTTNDLVKLVEGRHILSKYLRKAKRPMILMGTSFWYSNDWDNVRILIDYLRLKTFSLLKTWNGFNYVTSNLTELHLNYLGIRSKSFSKQKSLMNFQTDCLDDDFSKSFSLIYNFNSYLTNIQSKFVINLPVSNIFEEQNLCLNMEQSIQFSPNILGKFENSRNLKDVLEGIVRHLNIFDVNIQMRSILDYCPKLKLQVNFHESFFDRHIIFLYKTLFKSKKKVIIKNNVLGNKIQNFYMTDIVTKNSPTMTLSARFLDQYNNFE